MLEPFGTQVVLNCRVGMEYRTTWSIKLPGQSSPTPLETQEVIDFLTSINGIVSEISSTGNREPPLRINGTEGNDGTTVQCISIDLMNPTSRCLSAVVGVTFYGKTA